MQRPCLNIPFRTAVNFERGLSRIVKEMEECLIAEALNLAGGNQGAAASLLGISRQALNKRLTRRAPEGS